MANLKSGPIFAGIFVLSTLALQAYAADNVSLRLRGMGTELANIMTDEYTDSRFFAVDVLKVDGTKLYTGLSNISEDAFHMISNNGADVTYNYGYDAGSNIASNENTLGLVTGFLGLKGELIYQPGHIAGHRYTDPETTTVRVNKIGGNDLTMTDTSSTREDYRESSNDIVGTVARKSGNMDLALRLYLDSGADNLKTTYVHNTETTGVLNGSGYSDSTKITVTRADTDTHSEFGVELGAGLPFWKGNIALNLGLGPVSDDDNTDFNADYHDIDFGTDTETIATGSVGDVGEGPAYVNDTTVHDGGLGFVFRGKYTMPLSLFGKPMKLNSFAEYSHSSNSFTDDETLANEGTITRDVGNNRIVTTQNASYSESTINVKRSNNGVDLSLGSEISLNPITSLGFGIKFDYAGTKSARSGGRGSTSTVKVTQSVNGVTDNANSYTETQTNTDTVDMDTATSDITLAVPVGLETNLTKNLKLRMGATAFLIESRSRNTKSTTTFGKTETTRTYLTGATDVPIVNDRTGESDVDVDSSVRSTSRTVFSTGLGYALNDNISFDIVGFGNLTRLDTWTLSANIKF